MAQLKDLSVSGDARIIGNLYDNNPRVGFGTCSSAADAAIKVVVIDDPAWTLKKGNIIGVHFTNTNTAALVKLNVNNSGAIHIAYDTDRPFIQTDSNVCGYADRTLFYQYDGEYWQWISAGYGAGSGGGGDSVPIGALSSYIGTIAPEGYLLCQGQKVSKTTYPELYAICGTTFGPETTTEFTLPDLRGQVIAGYKQGDATFGTLGALIGGKTTAYTPAGTNTGTAVTLNAVELTHSGGAVQSHTLTVNEMPSHNHQVSYLKQQAGNDYQFCAGVGAWQTTGQKNGNIESTGGGQGHSHGFTQPSKHSFTPTTKSITQPTFTGTAANISTIQPTIILNWIVKAKKIVSLVGTVVNEASTSETDAYSCKYINDNYTKSTSLATVATSGSYNDLSNKPTIPTVVNNVTSTSTTNALSANMGKSLNDNITNLKRVTLFDGAWSKGVTKTLSTAAYKKLEFVLSINPSGSAYSTIFTIPFDNTGDNVGLIAGITKSMNGYFYQCEIQKKTGGQILFDYGAYCTQTAMGTWTVDDSSKGVITKVYGYKEI